jgi:NCS2 family nucleobase:cation symporter-2
VDEKLPTGRLAALDLQHVLVMYAGAVAVPLIVGRALKLSPEQVALLISADLFCCGLVTLIQSLGFGRWFGVRLPVMMGVTFAAVGPMVAMANANGGVEGARAIFGAIIGAGIISILIAPIMSRLLRYFPPVVTGTITAIIGISLMRVGVGWALGGPANLAQSVDVPKLVAMVDAAKATAEAASDLLMILTMTLVMIVVMIESTGMFLALGDITGKKISQTELSAGLRTDGLGTLIGGIFNTFPYTSFSQNVGLVGVTGVKSRWVCVAAGVIMLVLGLLPKMAALVESVPTFVLGGAGLVMFGMVAATGIRILSNVDFKRNQHNLYIVAISIGFGLVPLVAPRWTQQMAHGLHPLLESGILLTSIAAVVLNLYFNGSRSDTRDAVEASKSFTGGH